MEYGVVGPLVKLAKQTEEIEQISEKYFEKKTKAKLKWYIDKQIPLICFIL